MVYVSHRCFVSFTVDQDVLSLSEIKELLVERNSSLEALGYPILAVSQGAYIDVSIEELLYYYCV